MSTAGILSLGRTETAPCGPREWLYDNDELDKAISLAMTLPPCQIEEGVEAAYIHSIHWRKGYLQDTKTTFARTIR